MKNKFGNLLKNLIDDKLIKKTIILNYYTLKGFKTLVVFNKKKYVKILAYIY